MEEYYGDALGGMDEDERPEEKKHMTEKELAFLDQYLKEVEQMPMLAADEVEALYGKAMDGDDKAIRDLTGFWMREIVPMAQDKWVYGLHIGDLLQEGNLAVFQALNRLEKESPSDPAAYVKDAAEEAMESFRSEHMETAADNSRLAGQLNHVLDVMKELTEEYGDAYTLDDVAVRSGLTREELSDLADLVDPHLPDDEG